MSISLKASQVSQAIKHAMLANRPVMVWSAPGIGKSELIAQIGEEMRYLVNDNLRGSHTLPEDLRVPKISGENGQDEYLKWFICQELAECHASDTPRIIFIDELSAAAPSVQAIFYQLLGDKKTPDGRKLGDHVYIIGAGNRESDGAIAYKMPTALKTRLIHITMEVDCGDWVDWANTHDIDPVVIAFIRSRPELLQVFSNQSKNEQTFPCPRTWKYVSDLVTVGGGKGTNPEVEHAMIVGTVGEGAAVEFSAYLRLYRNLPDIDAILANPKGVRVPKDASELYALSAMVAKWMCAKNLTASLAFLDRLPAEYGIMAVTDATKRDKTLRHTKQWGDWAIKNHAVMM